VGGNEGLGENHTVREVVGNDFELKRLRYVPPGCPVMLRNLRVLAEEAIHCCTRPDSSRIDDASICSSRNRAEGGIQSSDSGSSSSNERSKQLASSKNGTLEGSPVTSRLSRTSREWADRWRRWGRAARSGTIMLYVVVAWAIFKLTKLDPSGARDSTTEGQRKIPHPANATSSRWVKARI